MNKNKTTFAIAGVIVAVAALLVTASGNNSAFAWGHHHHHHSNVKQTQTLAQENACGNGSLPLGVFCQNAASQIQGSDNAANVIASQP